MHSFVVVEIISNCLVFKKRLYFLFVCLSVYICTYMLVSTEARAGVGSLGDGVGGGCEPQDMSTRN